MPTRRCVLPRRNLAAVRHMSSASPARALYRPWSMPEHQKSAWSTRTMMAGSVYLDSDNLAKIAVDWSGPDRSGGTISQSNQIFIADTGANITTVSAPGLRAVVAAALVSTAAGSTQALLRGPVTL